MLSIFLLIRYSSSSSSKLLTPSSSISNPINILQQTSQIHTFPNHKIAKASTFFTHNSSNIDSTDEDNSLTQKGINKLSPIVQLKIQSFLPTYNNLDEYQEKNGIFNFNIKQFLQCSRTDLTPQIVQKDLLNCPSDIIALMFFLWCAKQPHYFHDRPTFNYMVNVVSRLSNRFETVKGIIDELRHFGCVIKPQTLLLLLRIYWCGGMFIRCFEVYELIIDRGYTPNTFARNVVIDVLFKLELVEVALNVFKETEAPNFLSFSIVITNLCKLNALVSIKDVHTRMMRKGYYLNGETYLMILSCFGKAGRIREAFQLLGLMISLGFRICVRHWSILIDMFCKCGRLDVAYLLLRKMVESGYSPNVETYTPLIKGFLESNKSSKAFELLYIMESKGCYVDLVLCNVLIHSLSKMGRCNDALDVFYSLQERGLSPDAYTFCSMIDVVCSLRQYALLPVILDGFTVQPDLVVCNSLINYFCKAGHPVGAIEFYEDMIDRGYAPDKYSFTTLIGALCKAGRTDDAVNVYKGIVRSHCGLDARFHTVIVSGLIKSGKFNRAITLFREAVTHKFPLDIVSYTIVIDTLFKCGQTEEAYNLFSQMKEAGIAPGLEIYNLILSHFCKYKNVKMVKEIIQEMVVMGIKVDCTTICSMKNLLYKSKDPYSALNMIIELRDSGLLPLEECEKLNKIIHGIDLEDTVDADTSGSDGILDAAVTAC
ncbi:chaperone [Lithospermum erythrorhizon]|uniref:Chaperone n=1 Tax=Lithospermum erythrorhizon TaxID=34254 RepID=A0AAV3R1M8_LITER